MNYTISRTISELFYDYSDLCPKYLGLRKNMPLFYQTSQEYNCSQTVELGVDNVCAR